MSKVIKVEQVASAFFFNYHSVVNGRFIRLDGSEYKKAKSNPKMWLSFERITKVINENDIDYQDYIKYTFEYFKKYVHPKTLINIGNLRRYDHMLSERSRRKNNERIYNNIMKSIKHVVLICKAHDLPDVSSFFKFCIQNDLLGVYLVTGSISKHYLSMFNNIEEIGRHLSIDSHNELDTTVLQHKEQLNQVSRQAILDMTGRKKISIIKITNYNISKQLGIST